MTADPRACRRVTALAIVIAVALACGPLLVAQGGNSEGIKVHGHWVIVVNNPMGRSQRGMSSTMRSWPAPITVPVS